MAISRRAHFNQRVTERLVDNSFTGNDGIDISKAHTARNNMKELTNFDVDYDGGLVIRKPLLVACTDHNLTTSNTTLVPLQVKYLYDNSTKLLVAENYIELLEDGEHKDIFSSIRYFKLDATDYSYSPPLDSLDFSAVEIFNTASTTIISNVKCNLVSLEIYDSKVMEEEHILAAPRYLIIYKEDGAWYAELKKPTVNTFDVNEDIPFNPNTTQDYTFMARDSYNAGAVQINGIIPYAGCRRISSNKYELHSDSLDISVVKEITENNKDEGFRLLDTVRRYETFKDLYLKAFIHVNTSSTMTYLGIWERTINGVDYEEVPEFVASGELIEIKVSSSTASEELEGNTTDYDILRCKQLRAVDENDTIESRIDCLHFVDATSTTLEYTYRFTIYSIDTATLSIANFEVDTLNDIKYEDVPMNDYDTMIFINPVSLNFIINKNLVEDTVDDGVYTAILYTLESNGEQVEYEIPVTSTDAVISSIYTIKDPFDVNMFATQPVVIKVYRDGLVLQRFDFILVYTEDLPSWTHLTQHNILSDADLYPADDPTNENQGLLTVVDGVVNIDGGVLNIADVQSLNTMLQTFEYNFLYGSYTMPPNTSAYADQGFTTPSMTPGSAHGTALSQLHDAIRLLSGNVDSTAELYIPILSAWTPRLTFKVRNLTSSTDILDMHFDVTQLQEDLFNGDYLLHRPVYSDYVRDFNIDIYKKDAYGEYTHTDGTKYVKLRTYYTNSSSSNITFQNNYNLGLYPMHIAVGTNIKGNYYTTEDTPELYYVKTLNTFTSSSLSTDYYISYGSNLLDTFENIYEASKEYDNILPDVYRNTSAVVATGTQDEVNANNLLLSQNKYSFIFGDTTEFAYSSLGNSAEGLKLYHKRKIYSYGVDIFKNNIFPTDTDSFDTPLFNVIDLTASSDTIVTTMVAWRDYIVAATETAIYLVNESTTKTINTFIGIPYNDRRTCKAILNGIVFKSGDKIYILTPNLYSSDETILNLSEISVPVSEYVRYNKECFAFTTEEAYFLFLPGDSDTVCIKYEYTRKVWTKYNYPKVFKDFHIVNLDDIRIIDTEGVEYYFNQYIEDVTDLSKAVQDIIYYGDYLTELPTEENFTDVSGYKPIEFLLDSGQKSDNLMTTKQFVESKLMVATQAEGEMFPFTLTMSVDGVHEVSTAIVGTDSAFWLDAIEQGGSLGNVFGTPTSSNYNILRQLLVRYSGKGKSIRHVLTGVSMYKFKIYVMYYKFKNLKNK